MQFYYYKSGFGWMDGWLYVSSSDVGRLDGWPAAACCCCDACCLCCCCLVVGELFGKPRIKKCSAAAAC